MDIDNLYNYKVCISLGKSIFLLTILNKPFFCFNFHTHSDVHSEKSSVETDKFKVEQELMKMKAGSFNPLIAQYVLPIT